jgi:hypothetical protein
MKVGVKVDKSAVNLAQTGTIDLFTVSGGKVLCFGLLSEVTTIIQAQANATKFIAHPAAGSDVDLCATADINALEAGGFLSVDGVLATAAVKTLAGAAQLASRPFILPSGCVVRQSCAANNTGQMKHSLMFLPLDAGAIVTAN